MKINIPDKIELVPLNKVQLYDTGVLEHTEEQLDKIVKSLHSFGQTNPLIVDSQYKVITGGAVYLACQQAGFTEVEVIVLSHLSETQARAYAIADNQIAKDSGWDEDLLSQELSTLNALGIDINELGFDFSETDFEIPEPIAPIAPEPVPQHQAPIPQPVEPAEQVIKKAELVTPTCVEPIPTTEPIKDVAVETAIKKPENPVQKDLPPSVNSNKLIQNIDKEEQSNELRREEKEQEEKEQDEQEEEETNIYKEELVTVQCPRCLQTHKTNR